MDGSSHRGLEPDERRAKDLIRRQPDHRVDWGSALDDVGRPAAEDAMSRIATEDGERYPQEGLQPQRGCHISVYEGSLT